MKKISIITTISIFLLVILLGATEKPIRLIINGYESDSSPRIIDGQVYVPVRKLAIRLNEDVVWDNKNRIVTIHPDVWKGGEMDFGRDAIEWPNVRNAILKYFMAVEENDPEFTRYVSADFTLPDDIDFKGQSFLDIKFMDGKKQEGVYTVRVNTILFQPDTEHESRKIIDVAIDSSTLKIEKIELVQSYPIIHCVSIFSLILQVTPMSEG